MTAGEVVGVVQHAHETLINVDCNECGVEHAVSVCATDQSRCVRPGDFVWTQSMTVYWSSNDLGLEDVPLNRHRTYFDGTHPCCLAPKSEEEPL